MKGDIRFDDNDILVTQNGDISVCDENESIIQEAIHNIRIKYGELETCQDRGNRLYTRRLKVSNSAIPQIERDCREAILWDTRVSDAVVDVKSFDGLTFDMTFELAKASDGTILKSDILTSIGG